MSIEPASSGEISGESSRSPADDSGASSTEQRKRPRGRPFQKGRSGNPDGRRREKNELRDLTRKHTGQAVKTLVEALGHKDGKVRVAAAVALLDRGWGRPAQAVTGADGSALFDAGVVVLPAEGD